MENITISSVMGNGQRLDGGAMFGNAPRALWSRWFEPDDLGRIQLACRSMLIKYDGKTILCEAGIGNFMEPSLAERFGAEEQSSNQLLESLYKLDVSHEDIDFVVLSHLHFDHAGGILPSYRDIKAGNDGLLFPKAKFIVGKQALLRAKSPHIRDRASFIADLPAKLAATGRLLIVGDDGNGDRCPGFFEDRIRFFYSEGHTPGQMHLIFHGGETTAVFAGDLVPGLAWLHLPMSMGYDRFPERLIDEKASLYKKFEDRKWLLFYTHDPEIACSKIRQNGKGRYIAYDEMPLLCDWKL